ncbi:MAG: FtsH protease activity modulator HflK, partial [Verrucomicrobia bacterium]|nr:FtsH protease activity modulator HflK [Verrucomicrobiota bacterium]
EFCQRVVRTVNQNIWWFAIIFNGTAVFAASQAWIGPIGAAITHQIASLLVVCNSLRLLWTGAWLRKVTDAMETRTGEVKESVGKIASYCRSQPRRVRNAAAALIVLGYLASGFTAINPDEVGVRLHFGRHVATLAPGLRYVWPWPCDQVLRVDPDRVQRVQVGLRAIEVPPGPAWWQFWARKAQTGVSAPLEPSAYEWNYEHKGGFRFVPEEATTVAGDENFVAVTLVVHYVVKDPATYLFATADPAGLVKAMAEAALRDAVGREPGEHVLTTERARIEQHIRDYLQQRLDRCGEKGAGITVQSVWLQDVHPPIELVDAYRDVASAIEEKSRVVNEAEGYANEQVPLARGTATNLVATAAGLKETKVRVSTGQADRFTQTAKALGPQRGAQAERFYLELMEELLPSQQVYVIDQRGKGSHQIYLLNERLKAFLGQSAQPAPAPAPQRPSLPEE